MTLYRSGRHHKAVCIYRQLYSTRLKVARQKLPKDWIRRLQTIQAKSAEAIKDLPSGMGPQQDASPLDYLRAVEIRDGLASKCERTLFGGLTGQAAVWDKIVKAYENGGE